MIVASSAGHHRCDIFLKLLSLAGGIVWDRLERMYACCRAHHLNVDHRCLHSRCSRLESGRDEEEKKGDHAKLLSVCKTRYEKRLSRTQGTVTLLYRDLSVHRNGSAWNDEGYESTIVDV